MNRALVKADLYRQRDIGKKRNIALMMNLDFRRRSNGLIAAKMQFLIPGNWMEHQGWQNQLIASRNEIRRRISQREFFADVPRLLFLILPDTPCGYGHCASARRPGR